MIGFMERDGLTWRAWLAENEPKTEALFRQLESDGVEI